MCNVKILKILVYCTTKLKNLIWRWGLWWINCSRSAKWLPRSIL